ncbi:flagellar assembly protein A [Aromatoleum toluclasticum]|uniref:flagellar assembly protein A n=1 Tax=Aromatoleum toluclasticum TaxID=92003 RepID=UPI000373DC7D|nr:flagellar assembly protein A [Aromatoleum toluclasticum]
MVANVAESRREGDEPLPGFIVRDEGGLWADLPQLGSSADFRAWVEQAFIRGICFRGLDYPAFVRLAFDCEAGRVDDEVRACAAAGRSPRVRFAAAITHILPVRIPLYRGLKISGARAEYLFEPVSIDCTVPHTGAGGSPDGAEFETVTQKTRLDFDEFIAQAWLKGLRCGIDEAALRGAIDGEHTGRVVIAHAVPPGAGRDAGVEELSAGLHRDDAPGLLPDGRVNLASFRNRFPQIRAGERLLRKVPLVLGEAGRELDGRAVAPALPKDVDFAALAGAGTRVESGPDGEFMVATIDGFLDIDDASSKVSVTEKIVNRAGVSLRTTGDLVLMGDDYEEHGEIQEGRVVEGFNMTSFADVFGKLVSRGGAVVLKKNLSGGVIVSPGGQVAVEGRASGATILAPEGEVTLQHAENSLIVGRRVVIRELAVGCDILAEELEIALAEASVLAGRRIAIAQVRPHGPAETVVSVLLPPEDTQGELITAARAQLAELQAADEQAKPTMETLRARPGVANYLTVAARLHRQEIVLNAEQQAAFHKLRDSVTPVLRAMAQLSEQGKARAAQREKLLAAIAGVEAARQAAVASIRCRIADVAGDLIVRTRHLAADAKAPQGLAPGELRAFLRATPGGSRPLFSGCSGSFDWSPAGSAGRTD